MWFSWGGGVGGGKGYAVTRLLSLARRSGCYAVTCSQDARRNHYPSTSSHTCVGLVAWSVDKEDACFCANSITSCCSLDHVLPQSLSEMLEKPDFLGSWNVLALYMEMAQKVGDLIANGIAFVSAMWHTTRWSSLEKPKSNKRYASVEHSCWTRSGATWSASYPCRSIAKTKLPGRSRKDSQRIQQYVWSFAYRWNHKEDVQRSTNANAESMKEKSRASKAVEVSFSKIHICQLFSPIEFNDQWVIS